MHRDTILILDFGSQYTQLIARRLRELSVYSEILPPGTRAESLQARHPRGIVLSGGPDSVHQRGAPRCDPKLFELGVPVVGHLLRHAAHEPRAGRRGEALRAPRVRPGRVPAAGERGALPRPAAAEPRLGEPRRRHPQARPRASASPARPRPTRSRRSRTSARQLYGMLFHPEVVALRGGRQGPRQLPRRHRLPPRLERALVRRGGDRARARAGGAEGQGHLRALGRRRLGGRGAHRQARDRRAAHLRVRGQRPAAQGRGGAGAQALRGAAAAQGGVRRRLARASCASSRASRTPSASARSSGASSSRCSRPRCARRARPTSWRRARSTRT